MSFRVLANRAHAWLLVASRGRIGATVGGRPVLVLETHRRRTGRTHRTPVQYKRHRSGFVVVASNAGRRDPPAWSLNLVAEPFGRAFVGRRWVAVQARVTLGNEREQLWQALSDGSRWLAQAAARVGHDLPVIVLRPSEERRCHDVAKAVSGPLGADELRLIDAY
jgi:deazaflavin-dependent oxidoreductase (nitroreductase family)